MFADFPFNLAEALGQLKPKDKSPGSANILKTWIAKAENDLHSDGGRLGWLVATTAVAAVLQRATDEAGTPWFLLKGGTLLQHRLPDFARATTDLDGLIRGDIDSFLAILDSVLRERWGSLTFRRGEVEVIDTPAKIVKPRRFDVIAQLNGVTWRRIQVEISPDEGGAGAFAEPVTAPSLAGFGLPTPDYLVGLAMRYQIAQKVHAATDPHEPPVYVNERARDVVDLLLIKALVDDTGEPTLAAIREAIRDIFSVRAAEAQVLKRLVRPWPVRLVAYPHWRESFDKAAAATGLMMTLEDAVGLVNVWLDEVDAAC
ncbi:MAG: nucleotidyl transferase AbiEii/AbiGii toxin family protein [Propionibacteriaceae bacterium]|jgi:hypothetical protein|nr:nucleotidyl transferase AbiEii/AbiGii toxin family protein [Propionibacteriaceae bacterium]